MLLYVRETTADVRESIKQQERGEMMIQMLENVQEPFILLDTGLTITAFNKSANDLMVLSTGKSLVKDTSILDYTDGEKRKEKAWKIYREALSGLLVEREIRLYPKGSSSPRIIRMTYKPFFDAEGHVYGIFQGGTDITAELALTKAAKEQQHMLQALTENTSDALLILDQNQRITFASKATEHILGYTVAESLGRKGLSMLHPDDTALAAREMENILIQPEIPINIRVRGIHKDGTTQWLQLKALNRLEDPAVNGLLVYISQIGALRDLELERVALQQVAEKMAEKGDMAVFCFDEADRLLLSAGAAEAFLEAEALPQQGTELQALLKPWGRKVDSLRKAASTKGFTSFKPHAQLFGGRIVEATLFQLSEQPNRWALLLQDKSTITAHQKYLREKPGIDKQIADLQQFYNRASVQQALLHRAVVCSLWRFDSTSKTLHFEPSSAFALPGLNGTLASLQELEEAVHPEDWKLFDFLMRNESPENSLQQQFDCRLRAHTGIYESWSHWSVALYVDGVHEVYGLWLRGAVENKLDAHDKLTAGLSEVFSKTDIGWVLVAGEGQIWEINAKARELLALEDVVAVLFHEVPGLSRTLLEHHLNKAKEERREQAFEYFHAPSGLWMEVNIIPDLYATHIILIQKSGI